MSTRRITVSFSEAEARALRMAAGNSLVSADDARNVLGHESKVRAAMRAQAKLTRAIAGVTCGGTGIDPMDSEFHCGGCPDCEPR